MFERLRTARAYARRQMAFVETLEDVDIILEVGFHQEQGMPLSMTGLYRLHLASVATVQRRVRRLRATGALVTRRAAEDRRSVEILLSSRALKACEKYAELLGVDGEAFAHP